METFLEVPSVEVMGHLISVPNTEWALWRWIGLRSAGFPASDVLKLAAPAELGAAADQMEAALRAKDLALDNALRQISQALDDLKQSGQWNSNRRRVTLLKVKRRLQAKQVPEPSPEINALDSIKEFRVCLEQADAARKAFQDMFFQVSGHISEVISEITDCSRFREAVTWQNRKLVPLVFDVLRRKLPQSEERNSALRQKEQLIATYLQRYCMKNDTIGFFGPVGWAKFVADGDRLVSIPGPDLITARRTYWEAWPIEKLASMIQQNPRVLPWIPPILMPLIRVEGSILYHPVFGSVRLTPRQAAVIQACDGYDAANQIASKILATPGKLFTSEDEVYACLRELAAKRVIFWAINVPSCPHPEQALRAALEGIGDSEVRRSSLDMLDHLDAAKQDVAAAAGNAEKLADSFDRLEKIFTGLTMQEATRNPGKTYAGRTLVYEDCRRDLEVLIGPELFHELIAPLSLLLISARWITAEIREAYRMKLTEIYSELAATTGRSAINAVHVWKRLRAFLAGGASDFCHPLQQEFQERWQRVLRLGQKSGPLKYSSDDLRKRVLSEFPAGGDGWTGTRYHSPDLMIAADSEDAIQKGEYCFVLGELHLSMNALDASFFVHQHPSPEELLQAVEHDLGSRNLIAVIPRNEEIGCRMAIALITPSNLRLEYGENNFVTDRSRVVPISSLWIESQGGQLLAKTRDGRFQTEAVSLVRAPLMGFIVDSFKMMGPQAHSPRISIDRLIIKRESWRFSAFQLAFAREATPADRYAHARRWRHDHGMPRFVFFKAPAEPKPCYLDFESPILVDVFCKMVRRSQEDGSPRTAIEISEMLPNLDQIWLKDATGHRYTSEFRVVAVDKGKPTQ